MNIKRTAFILLFVVFQSAFSYQGYLSLDNDNDVIFTINDLCLLRNVQGDIADEYLEYAFHEEGGEGKAYVMRYNLSGDTTIDQIDKIKHDLSAVARSLSNYDRTNQCGEVTYGLNANNWHFSVNDRNLNLYSTSELHALLGAESKIVPVHIVYGETPIDIITK